MNDPKHPTTSGVYLLFSGPRCVYVGSALNLRARLSGHPHTGKFDRVEYIDCSPMDLAAREEEQIALHRPALNKRAKAGRSSGHKADPAAVCPPQLIPSALIAQWIDGLRQEGETIDGLAERIGVSRQTLSAIINGRRIPGANLIKRLRPYGMVRAEIVYKVNV